MIRTAEGRWVKENPEVTAKLESDLIRWKTAHRRAEILETLKEHPGWVVIKEVLTDKLKTIQRQLNEFEKVDHRQVDLLLQEKKDFTYFAEIVDDFVESRAGFESLIEKTEAQLRERKSNAPAPV